MIFIKMQLIVIASFLILASETTVRLLKKRIHNGVKFSRMIKYTNQSIIGMKNNENSKMAQELSLDVLMVADFSTYQAFLEISNNDDYSAQHYLNNYLTAIFEQTKLIYDKIKFGSEALKLRFAGTFIARREEDCPLWLSWEEENEEAEDQLDQIESNSTWIHDQTSGNLTFSDEESDALDPSSNSSEFRVPRKKLRRFVDSTLEDLEDNNSTEMSLKIDSKRAIDKFTVWIKQYSDFLPRHEHAVLITKFDLISINGHSATQGMAYVGNVCQLGESSSVVEDIGASLTALIAAHEIGHSLGALHDGAFEAAECDSNDNFLLAAAISGSSNRQTFLNSRAMSNCSIRSIIENFKRPSASCVKKWGQNSRGSEKGSERSDKFSRLPGETISSTQQCQVAFGPTFGTCRNRGYYHHRSICERVWCSDRRDRHNDVCQTLNYFPAFDGTECGYNLWCIEGECVKNPKKWMDCTDLNSKTCSKYSASKLKHFCKSKDFRDICCRTCAKKGKIV